VTPFGDRVGELPIDPDVDADVDALHRRREDPFRREHVARRRLFRPSIVVAVFAGGCVGGAVRYAVTDAWPVAAGGFPWSTLVVNLVGAFVLSLLVVVVAELSGPSAYLRPLVGTGFCGALTTFSSVVVSVDRLAAHGRPGLAATYLVVTMAAGLVVGMAGVMVGREVAERRHRRLRTGES
jgi:fluoride exporter